MNGHLVFKFDIQSIVSVNRVKFIPIPSSIIDRINAIGEAGDQLKGIKFRTMDSRVADLGMNQNDNSNVILYPTRSTKRNSTMS